MTWVKNPRPPEERFWEKVRKSESCWEWTAQLKQDGYGYFRVHSSLQMLAHRYSWTLSNGPIPKGMLVCHHCDNPKCVRAEHLFLGSNNDNYQDSARKGRRVYVRGERIATSKLTADDVVKIRAKRDAGQSGPSIAREFGVSHVAVYKISKREFWAHVGDGPASARAL